MKPLKLRTVEKVWREYEVKNLTYVTTDILMPEMEGTELLTSLHEKNMDVKVIVVSANIQDAIRDQCINLGVSEFFNKPPDKKKLKKAIEERLN